MESKYKLSSPAFTIVELLVVIVVIGILAAITIVSYTGISSRATVSSLQSDLTNALTQLKLDQVTNSMFPSSLSAANGGKGIPSSSGTSYTYAYSNATTPQTFCITATKNNTSYNITGDGNPQPGICPVLNLDAGNISSYPGTGTTWTDLSGNGNSGTLNGGVTYSAVNGGVLGFDGVNGHASIVGAVVQDTATYVVWVYPIAYASSHYSIFSQKAGSTHSRGIRNSTTDVFAWTRDGTGIWQELNVGSYTVNRWTQIALVQSGNVLKGYRDGVYIGQTTFVGFLSNYTGIYEVGKYTNSDFFFNGFISNVLVYDSALSAGDIQQNFNSLRSHYGI